MPITITINSNNAQALAFIEYAKKLDFAHRDFLMKLSNQVKKNAAKRFYTKPAKMKTEK